MKISVCIITYNQELHIENCLKGALAQKLNCDYEIIIGEDASTDGTLAICKQYAEKYPHLIKLISGSTNLGMMKNANRTMSACKGDYIAPCEGDDYWTDPLKLQRQLDFLELNLEYSMIAENGLVINNINNKEYNFNSIGECDLEICHLLEKRQFPTASVLFRKKALNEAYYNLKYTGDTVLWCYLATRGKIKYLPNVSSVYTRGLHGIVESSRNINWARLMENWNNEILNIVPKKFKRNIEIKNYKEYLKAFQISAKEKDLKNSLLSIKKCFIFQPISTIKFLIKFLSF